MLEGERNARSGVIRRLRTAVALGVDALGDVVQRV